MKSGQFFTHHCTNGYSQAYPESHTQADVVKGDAQARSDGHTDGQPQRERFSFCLHKSELTTCSQEWRPTELKCLDSAKLRSFAGTLEP